MNFMLQENIGLYKFYILSQKICASCHFQIVQVDIPQSLFEEQGRQLYGANLLEIQVLVASCTIFRPIRQLKFQLFYITRDLMQIKK